MTFKFTSNLSFPQHKKTLTYCRAVSSPALDIPSPALPAANHLCHPGRWWDWVLSTWSLLHFPSKSPEILPSVWIWARLGLFFLFTVFSSWRSSQQQPWSSQSFCCCWSSFRSCWRRHGAIQRCLIHTPPHLVIPFSGFSWGWEWERREELHQAPR